jgi:hypothetical protein
MKFLQKIEAAMTHKQLLKDLLDIRHALSSKDYNGATQIVHRLIDDLTDSGGGVKGEVKSVETPSTEEADAKPMSESTKRKISKALQK